MPLIPEEEARLLRIELAARALIQNGIQGWGNRGYRPTGVNDRGQGGAFADVSIAWVYEPELNDLKEALGLKVDRSREGWNGRD